MKRKHLVRIPPITRVHNLYRLRFTTIEIDELIKRRKPPTSISFEKCLTEVRLSKTSKLKLRDRIGRRSRDHLATSTYLGLLKRVLHNNQYYYSPSFLGLKLLSYEISDECPKDSNERSAFTTALLKLKYINGHYEDVTFIQLRYRPVVVILFSLSKVRLNIYQLYYILGKTILDPTYDTNSLTNLINTVANTDYSDEKGLLQFIKDFKLRKADINEAGRSLRPLLSWCIQTGLIWSDDDNFYHIESAGHLALKSCMNIFPIWYKDLGHEALKKAVILHILFVANIKNIEIPVEFFDDYITFNNEEFFNVPVKELIKEIKKEFNFFNKRMLLNKIIDFDILYDVPPEYHDQVLFAIRNIESKYNLMFGTDEVVKYFYESFQSSVIYTKEENEIKILSEHFGVQLPNKSLFRVPFEYNACLILRLMQFNANKYQGQLSDVVSPSLKNFAENNPDILVTNSTIYLIECKSINEWSNETSYNKRVRGELSNYHDLTNQTSANCAIILVEGEFYKEDFFIALQEDLKNWNNILFISYSSLEKIKNNKEDFTKLKKILHNPQDYPPEKRIFANYYNKY